MFRHRLDLTGRDVLVHLPVGTLGDTLGWFPYVAKFERQHRCRLTCVMAEPLIPLFRDAYSSITLVTPDRVDVNNFYATYNIGLFFTDDANVRQPCDFRLVGLHRTAAYILGVDPQARCARDCAARSSRPIPEKYVCIAAQSIDAVQILEQPERLARNCAVSAAGRLPRNLHRPEGDARQRPRVESHTVRLRGLHR